MKALILNSGMGSRMGDRTQAQPKCMTRLWTGESILSRQFRQLGEAGVREVVLTTGYLSDVLTAYCMGQALPFRLHFVDNPAFRESNYIYSIYLAREWLQDGEGLLLIHGDLVFSDALLPKLCAFPESCMAVSQAQALPEKDFKAVVRDGRIRKIGIEFFTDAVAAQPLYKLMPSDWRAWLSEIVSFCESGDVEKRRCYAEKAFNLISGQCRLHPFDVGTLLCSEVDTAEDLSRVQAALAAEEGQGAGEAGRDVHEQQ